MSATRTPAPDPPFTQQLVSFRSHALSLPEAQSVALGFFSSPITDMRESLWLFLCSLPLFPGELQERGPGPVYLGDFPRPVTPSELSLF